MRYHDLTKEELIVIKHILEIKIRIGTIKNIHLKHVEDILPKISKMIELYDWKCEHEDTSWYGDQKCCNDCGSMIWD